MPREWKKNGETHRVGERDKNRRETNKQKENRERGNRGAEGKGVLDPNKARQVKS